MLYKHIRQTLSGICGQSIVFAKFCRSFPTLFQGTEPLLHILFSWSRMLLKCFLHPEAYRNKSGEELKHADVDWWPNWKAAIEIGANTQATISDRTPEKMQQFRLSAGSFYVTAGGYLLSRLPLENSRLKDFRCHQARFVKVESSMAFLRNLAQEVPQVILPDQVSSLMDNFHLVATDNVDCSSFERRDNFCCEPFGWKQKIQSFNFAVHWLSHMCIKDSYCWSFWN